jgi:lysozyme
MSRPVNNDGLAIIKESEGLRLKIYNDGVGVWTIGRGHAIGRDRTKALALYPNGITIEQAEELFLKDVQSKALQIELLITRSVTDNQFAACVSLAFNIGVENFKNSTLLKKLNAGDSVGAAEQFSLWIKGTVNGQKVVLPGLVVRRKKEKLLFEKV